VGYYQEEEEEESHPNNNNNHVHELYPKTIVVEVSLEVAGPLLLADQLFHRIQLMAWLAFKLLQQEVEVVMQALLLTQALFPAQKHSLLHSEVMVVVAMKASTHHSEEL